MWSWDYEEGTNIRDGVRGTVSTDVHKKADNLYFLNQIQQSEKQPEAYLRKQLPPAQNAAQQPYTEGS